MSNQKCKGKIDFHLILTLWPAQRRRPSGASGWEIPTFPNEPSAFSDMIAQTDRRVGSIRLLTCPSTFCINFRKRSRRGLLREKAGAEEILFLTAYSRVLQ